MCKSYAVGSCDADVKDAVGPVFPGCTCNLHSGRSGERPCPSCVDPHTVVKNIKKAIEDAKTNIVGISILSLLAAGTISLSFTIDGIRAY